MASALCHSTLFFFLLIIAGLCDARTDYNTHDLEIARRHESWMVEYGRVYKDEVEKAMRSEIFKQNFKYIEDFNNAGQQNYTLGVNLFADLTNEEYKAAYASGLKIPDGKFEESLRSFKYETMEEEEEEEEEEEALNYTKIPDSVDWRAEGAVSSVKLQIKCNACWAFAAAATIEGIYKIKKGVLHDLSVQQIVDCLWEPLFDKCKRGGHVHEAYRYVIESGGLTTWTNYPYNDTVNKCDKTKANQTVASIQGFGRVLSSNRGLKTAVARQPVAVSVVAGGKDFQFYKEGIFDGICGTKIDHAIVAVGYGEEEEEKYWIFKNSYSAKWGEDGYIRMKREMDAREGLCGILTDSYYPTMLT